MRTTLPDWPYLLVQVVQRAGTKVCVTGHGDIDIVTAHILTDTVSTVLRQERPSHLEVNLAEVTFVDSSGLNALMACRARAEALGCRFTVSRPQPVVRRVMSVTGLLAAFGLAR